MTRYLSTVAIALALAAAVPAVAQHSLNVRDADIRAFIQDAARVTGRTFIIDQRVQGKVSVVTDRPLSRSEYFEVFLSTLRANGLVAVPTARGAFRIQPVETAAAQPGRVGSRGASQNQFVTEVFRLRAIDATSAAESIRPLVSREGSVTANRAGNSVIVADYADNIRRVRQLIQSIDRDSATTTLVPLVNAGPREIAAALQALVGGGGAGEGARPAAASIVPVDGSNAIVLRGDSATVARLAEVARELDRRAAAGTEIRVIFLENADADKLLPVLQQLTGQPVTQPSSSNTVSSRSLSSSRVEPSGPAGMGGASASIAVPPTISAPPLSGGGGGGESVLGRNGQAIVTRYEGANAVIIAANPATQKQLGELIRQLDIRQQQVLVEAIIVEISDAAAKRLGVQFLIGDLDVGFAATNFSNASPNLLTIAGAAGARELDRTTTVINGNVVTTTSGSAASDQLTQAAVNSILTATGGFGGALTRLGSDGVLGSIISAVQSDNKSNILSAPSITTLDNQEASFLVGQEIPITTGEALSDNFDNAFRTVQRQNVGIQLEVKPQISAGGAIKLFIRQEVSSIAGPVSDNFSDLILNKREFETTIIVDDGQIASIGGLLDDNERRTIEKIPLLGDLPLLGNLFRSKARSRNKTNLMVFIRPTIIRSSEDARRLTAQRYGYIRGQQLLDRPDREPTLDELVRDYMGATLPLPLSPSDIMVDPASLPPAPGDGVVQPVPLPPSTSTPQ